MSCRPPGPGHTRAAGFAELLELQDFVHKLTEAEAAGLGVTTAGHCGTGICPDMWWGRGQGPRRRQGHGYGRRGRAETVGPWARVKASPSNLLKATGGRGLGQGLFWTPRPTPCARTCADTTGLVDSGGRLGVGAAAGVDTGPAGAPGGGGVAALSPSPVRPLPLVLLSPVACMPRDAGLFAGRRAHDGAWCGPWATSWGAAPRGAS